MSILKTSLFIIAGASIILDLHLPRDAAMLARSWES